MDKLNIKGWYNNKNIKNYLINSKKLKKNIYKNKLYLLENIFFFHLYLKFDINKISSRYKNNENYFYIKKSKKQKKIDENKKQVDLKSFIFELMDNIKDKKGQSNNNIKSNFKFNKNNKNKFIQNKFNINTKKYSLHIKKLNYLSKTKESNLSLLKTVKNLQKVSINTSEYNNFQLFFKKLKLINNDNKFNRNKVIEKKSNLKSIYIHDILKKNFNFFFFNTFFYKSIIIKKSIKWSSFLKPILLLKKLNIFYKKLTFNK